MKLIKVGLRLTAQVDDADFDDLNQFRWNAVRQGKDKYRAYCQKTKIYMHRFITNAPSSMTVDHIDGNPLNNQRSNLRLCTLYMNTRNTRKKGKNPTSVYKGVYYDNRKDPLKKRWVAQIKVDYRTRKIGRFLTEKEAAEAYDRKAAELWGDMANLNFS